MELDARIKQAQRKSGASYVILGGLLALVFAGFFTWLFFVRGHHLIVLPSEAYDNYGVRISNGVVWKHNDSLYVLGSNADIEVMAPTFESVTFTLTPDSPENIEVVLPPTPATITAELNLVKPSAWYIDDMLVHVGNTLSHSLSPGDYQLRVENDYFQPFEQLISLKRAEQFEVIPDLVQVSGSLALTSSVAGSTISIDGKIFDAPFENTLEGGEYKIQVSARGYQSIEESIEITWQNKNPQRNYNLIPVQSTLIVSPVPTDGILLLDGVEQSGRILSVDANKEYEVQYRKPGFKPFKRTITLAPTEERKVDIQLEQALGQLRLSSQPSASVYINGQDKGKTPVNLTLPAVTYTLELRQSGYRSQAHNVSVIADATVDRQFSLMTEFAARRAEGRPLFIQQLGIQLKGFAADSVVLGSKVNEPGRRRNEHPVSIEFSRPFGLSIHEITQAQYAASQRQSSTSTLPVTNVTWHQAAIFTNWLSQQEGLPEFYQVVGDRVVGFNPNSNGYRLPTEAEWEWAAKKSGRTRATTYVWGDSDKIPKDIGNFADSSLQGKQLIYLSDYKDNHTGTAEVGSYRADRSGLFDMTGNVSEWVHDGYSNAIPDDSQVYVDYMGVAGNGQHVVKGGNYSAGRLRDLRAAYREPSAQASPTIGFRIARYLD